jgi:hypothetical protein
MPTLTKQYTLTVSPEQFLDACSANELHEVSLLLQSNRYQRKMLNGDYVPDPVPEMPVIPTSPLESSYPEKYGPEQI